MIAVTIIERGSVQAEFLSSSDKWTVESAPARYATGALRPIRQAVPTDDQPLDSNSVNTDDAELLGAVVL